jgi:hypothetical protein
MATQITIDAKGNTLRQNVAHGSSVYWKATPDAYGKFPQWFITFGPLLGQVFATHPNTGETDHFNLRAAIDPTVTYHYWVLDAQDPPASHSVGGKEGIIRPVQIIGGGGIIIDQ